jgi:hypothetical protein
MPHLFSWHDSVQGIIQIDVEKPATWDGYRSAIEQVVLALEETKLDRLDVVLMNNTAFPPGNPLPHFQWTLKRLLPYHKLGLFVVIDPSPQMRYTEVLSSAVVKAAGINYSKISAIVRTREEALDLIQKDRQTRGKKRPTARQSNGHR